MTTAYAQSCLSWYQPVGAYLRVIERLAEQVRDATTLLVELVEHGALDVLRVRHALLLLRLHFRLGALQRCDLVFLLRDGFAKLLDRSVRFLMKAHTSMNTCCSLRAYNNIANMQVEH